MFVINKSLNIVLIFGLLRLGRSLNRKHDSSLTSSKPLQSQSVINLNFLQHPDYFKSPPPFDQPIHHLHSSNHNHSLSHPQYHPHHGKRTKRTQLPIPGRSSRRRIFLGSLIPAAFIVVSSRERPRPPQNSRSCGNDNRNGATSPLLLRAAFNRASAARGFEHLAARACGCRG